MAALAAMATRVEQFGSIVEKMQIAEFLRLARMRRTVRKYTADPVSREAIENVLEAARWAPSGMNAQPLRYVVVMEANKDVVKSLAQ